MSKKNDSELIQSYLLHLSSKTFPCVAAREAVSRDQLHCFVAGHMACPKDDAAILHFLYGFIDQFRKENSLFHSASVIFTQPSTCNEEQFDDLMWQRLQALSDLDAKQFRYDHRVSEDPDSAAFSFSLKEEAFFVLGLHPQSSRVTRQFSHPVLVFNPHAQFEKMRETSQYAKMKNIVRKRDIVYSGSINPMLEDFGNSSEVYQYSGKQYDSAWRCPLKINHEPGNHHTTAKRIRISAEERAAS